MKVSENIIEQKGSLSATSPIMFFDKNNFLKINKAILIGDIAIISGNRTASVEIDFPKILCFWEDCSIKKDEQSSGVDTLGFLAVCKVEKASKEIVLQTNISGKACNRTSKITLSSDKEAVKAFFLEHADKANGLVNEIVRKHPDWVYSLKALTKNHNRTGNIKKYATENHLATIDHVIQVAGDSFVIAGWSFGEGNGFRELVIETAAGKKNILEGAYRLSRMDLLSHFGKKTKVRYEKAGFMVFVSDLGEINANTQVRVLYEGEMVNGFSLPAPEESKNSIEITKQILSQLDITNPNMAHLLDEHLGPAIAGLKFDFSGDVQAEIRQYGKSPTNPAVSIIVPLYGRYDFLEYQLSQFANDPDFFGLVDLVYVLDDPKLMNGFIGYCHAIAPLYKVPFKVISYDANLGYAGANNIGAKFADADYIIPLNSDVLPSKPRWSTKMVEVYKKLENCGVLGVRLLFPDNSLQHDGMEFIRFPFLGNLWINDHPGKGLPPAHIEKETSTVRVSAVTTACALISKKDFLEAGGFDEGYIIGDFEDSDLCLTLIAKGKSNYIARDIVLYHLERQSQSLFEDMSWKQKITIYNCWRHSKKWGKTLEKISGERC